MSKTINNLGPLVKHVMIGYLLIGQMPPYSRLQVDVYVYNIHNIINNYEC